MSLIHDWKPSSDLSIEQANLFRWLGGLRSARFVGCGPFEIGGEQRGADDQKDEAAEEWGRPAQDGGGSGEKGVCYSILVRVTSFKVENR